jgi:AcrR family transcriptional regulator
MRSVSALVGFLVGSGLYGTAWDLNSLIALRVLTAVPGSTVPVLTMVTVIAGLFPRARRTDSGKTSQALADAKRVPPRSAHLSIERVHVTGEADSIETQTKCASCVGPGATQAASGQAPRRGHRSDVAFNHDRILHAAARVLSEDPKATIQHIAHEAGVVRLTVYRHFSSRDALIRAIFEAAAIDTHHSLTEIRHSEIDPVEALRLIIVKMATIGRRYPLLRASTDLQSTRAGAPYPTTQSIATAFHLEVLSLIKRGQASGLIRVTLSAELLSHAIVGTLRVASPVAHRRGVDAASLGAEVADLLLNGFAIGTPRRPT